MHPAHGTLDLGGEEADYLLDGVAGQRKVREAEAVLDSVREDVLATLPADERETFLRALGRLACGRLAAPVACAQSVRRRG